MFSFFSKTPANSSLTAYDIKFKSIDGNTLDFADYKNKVLIVVNVASRCGFTNQYEDLQNLWENYKEKNVIIIGVPTNNFRQEPGSNKEIKDFCEANFNISFPMTEKIDVVGVNAHPFYKWAKESYGKSAIPKWNFHKILISKDGKVADTFSSITKPSSSKFKKKIENLI